MARIRIDWQRIRLLPAEDVLVVLDRQAAGVLLSIMHVFEWQALFRVGDYDFADWDYLQEILSSAEEAIGNPLRIADLLTELQLMTIAIESLYCCPDTVVDITDGDQFTNPIEEQEPNGVPTEIVGAGYATDDDDWDGYLDYKCMVANVAFDELKRKLGDFEQIVQRGGIGIAIVGTIAAIVGSLFGLGAFVLVAGVAAGIGTITALYDELLTAGLGFFENIAGALEAQRSDYIEALYCGDGPEGSYADFLTVVDANLDVASATVVRLMSTDIDLKTLYGGRYDQQDVAQNLADAGYDVGDYTCACVDPNEFDITYRYLSDAQGWVPGGTGTKNYDGAVGNPAGSLHSRGNNQTTRMWSLTGNQILADVGAPGGETSVTIYESHFDVLIDVAGGHAVRMFHAGVSAPPAIGFSGHPLVWTPYSRIQTEVLTNLPGGIHRFEHYGSNSTHYSLWLDNVRIVGRYD